VKAPCTTLLLLTTLGLPVVAWGQTCAREDLSKTLLFTTHTQRLKLPAGLLDSCVISVTITDKLHRRPPQLIQYSATHLANDAFSKCNAVRSYVTGTNQQAQVVDNDYGDLVVADFNFDGHDDFAVKLDSGGNGGPLYNFYLQKPSGQFALSSFLTEEMQFFPKRFDASRHTLTIVVHANYKQMRETTYQVNTQTDAWRQIRQRLVP
jgi:hypothetical protein